MNRAPSRGRGGPPLPLAARLRGGSVTTAPIPTQKAEAKPPGRSLPFPLRSAPNRGPHLYHRSPPLPPHPFAWQEGRCWAPAVETAPSPAAARPPPPPSAGPAAPHTPAPGHAALEPRVGAGVLGLLGLGRAGRAGAVPLRRPALRLRLHPRALPGGLRRGPAGQRLRGVPAGRAARPAAARGHLRAAPGSRRPGPGAHAAAVGRGGGARGPLALRRGPLQAEQLRAGRVALRGRAAAGRPERRPLPGRGQAAGRAAAAHSALRAGRLLRRVGGGAAGRPAGARLPRAAAAARRRRQPVRGGALGRLPGPRPAAPAVHLRAAAGRLRLLLLQRLAPPAQAAARGPRPQQLAAHHLRRGEHLRGLLAAFRRPAGRLPPGAPGGAAAALPSAAGATLGPRRRHLPGLRQQLRQPGHLPPAGPLLPRPGPARAVPARGPRGAQGQLGLLALQGRQPGVLGPAARRQHPLVRPVAVPGPVEPRRLLEFPLAA